jgi:hypothetical protein
MPKVIVAIGDIRTRGTECFRRLLSRSIHSRDYMVDHGFDSGLGAPCALLRCMRESNEWGPL